MGRRRQPVRDRVSRAAGGPVGQGILAGFAGTAAMTVGYAIERRMRRGFRQPLDYDDSKVPAEAAARVMDWSSPGPRATEFLGLAVHWGYGSLVGVGAVPLVRRTGPVSATAMYCGAITAMAAILFPVLGKTSPPWRWRKDVMLTSLGQHLVYAGVVVAVLGRGGRSTEDVSAANRPLT